MLTTNQLFNVEERSLLKLSNFVVFDIETTGLSYKSDDIIEICYISFNKNNSESTTRYLVHTDKRIAANITAINGINNNMLRNAPKVSSVLDEMFRLHSTKILVAHNCHKFDAKFLLSNYELFQEVKFLDTRIMAQYYLPGMPIGLGASESSKSYSMTALTNLFGIKINNQHTAEGDTSALSLVFRKLLGLVDSQEQLNLFIKKGSQLKL